MRLHNLSNHNTNLSDEWLTTLEHNPFNTCCKLSESKAAKILMLYIHSYPSVIIFV